MSPVTHCMVVSTLLLAEVTGLGVAPTTSWGWNALIYVVVYTYFVYLFYMYTKYIHTHTPPAPNIVLVLYINYSNRLISVTQLFLFLAIVRSICTL